MSNKEHYERSVRGYTTSLVLPHEMRDKLDAIAEETMLNRSALIRIAIRRYIEDVENHQVGYLVGKATAERQGDTHSIRHDLPT